MIGGIVVGSLGWLMAEGPRAVFGKLMGYPGASRGGADETPVDPGAADWTART
jgi:hypothetical protein